VELIGARLARLEDERLLQGQGRYVGDLRLPGMLHAAFVRCPHGSARVKSLSVDLARNLPGVVGAFTAADLPELSRPLPQPFPAEGLAARLPCPLATESVRFAGEAVAIVLAEDRYQAADGAAAVEVAYEELPCVIDACEVRLSGSPLVHADVPGNLVGTVSSGFGHIEAAFADAPITVRERLTAERMACAAMEPRCIAVQPGDGADPLLVTIFDSTQAPHNIRRGVAQTLGIEQDRVRVVAPDVGGGFGPKGRLYPEEVALAVLALHMKRAVMWQATRHEDLMTTYQGRGAVFEAEIASETDGRVRGLKVKIIQDCGAYASTALIVPQNSAQHLLGPYRWPAVQIDIEGVYTNKTPLSPLRGGGREMGVWATERMLDHLARRLDLDPVTVRKRNLIDSGDFPYDTGYPARSGGTLAFDSGDYRGCLERCKALIGYDDVRQAQEGERQDGRYRGVAITLFLESTGMASETARAELMPDGKVSLRIGSPSTGQGHATTMPQMFAHRFGIPVDQITYLSGDTAAVDDGVGTFGSRMALVAGNAAAMAGRQLRLEVLAAAADMFEASAEDLEIIDGRVQVRGVPERALSLSEIAQSAAAHEACLAVDATYTAEKGSSFAGGAHGAVVEVDVETGFVRVEKYVVVHDCGTVINPLLVEGQIHGGVIHGLGNSLKERMIYDDGARLRTDSFLTYAMPLATDAPRIQIEHHESPSPYNPEGIKGAGEGGTMGALATVAGAVEDALSPLNLELNQLPITPEDLFWACEPLRLGPSSELP
jgi:aerobic carbon-monoxide dehydrogenase large subunit